MESWKRQVQQFAIVAGMVLAIYLFFAHVDFGYDFQWAVLWEMNPTYQEVFGVWLLRGLLITIEISLISTVISLVLGTFFGIARLSSFKPLYWFATAYVEFFVIHRSWYSFFLVFRLSTWITGRGSRVFI